MDGAKTHQKQEDLLILTCHLVETLVYLEETIIFF